MMTELPKQLQRESLRFCFVNCKVPQGEKWQTKEHSYTFNDPKLLARLASGKNYGVIGSFGSIMIVDADDSKVIDAFSIFEDTFTVQTGNGTHFYYLVPDLDKSYALSTETEESTPEELKFENAGHITSVGRMVVGPGCKHYKQLNDRQFELTGKEYKIVKDVPIIVITKEQLLAVIKPFLADEIRKKYEVQREAKTQDSTNAINIPITPIVEKVLEEHPDRYKLANPGFRGHNPSHPDSKSRMDLAIDTKKNWWICARCASNGYGFGNSLYFIALTEEILQCHECKKGGLRGEKFLQVKKIAIEKYGVKPELFPKSTSTDMPSFNYMLGDKKLTVILCGYNGYKIVEKDNIICPLTRSKSIKWHESEFYRQKIANALTKRYKLKKNDAEMHATDMCGNAQKLIKERKEKGLDIGSQDDLQSILDRITSVNVIKSEDDNLYEIRIDSATIRLTDNQLYENGKAFAVQYLNRFLTKIIIPQEAWDTFFLPALLSDEKLQHDEDKLQTKADIVIGKFMMHLKNRQIFDWSDIATRVGYQNAVFYDSAIDVVRVSSEFINNFFEKERIAIQYKITIQIFSSYLHNEEYDFLERKRQSGKVGKLVKTFWMFKAKKLGIDATNITKTEPSVTVAHIPALDKFGEDGQ